MTDFYLISNRHGDYGNYEMYKFDDCDFEDEDKIYQRFKSAIDYSLSQRKPYYRYKVMLYPKDCWDEKVRLKEPLAIMTKGDSRRHGNLESIKKLISAANHMCFSFPLEIFKKLHEEYILVMLYY